MSIGSGLLGGIGDFFGNVGTSLVDNAGGIAAAGAGLAASNYAVNQGQDALQGIASDMTNRFGISSQGSLGSQIANQAEFKPFTVTNNLGGATYSGGNLDINAGNNALMQQANQMSGSIGNNNLMPYAQNLQQMGSQQIGQASQPQDLNLLRGQFANQASQGIGQPSQFMQELQNQAYQGAQFGQGGANVAGSFQGINAPQVTDQIGQIGQQASQNVNFGESAQNVSGLFSGLSAPNVSSTLGNFAGDTLGRVNFNNAPQDVTGAFSGIDSPAVREGAGGLANQAMQLGQGMLGQASPDAQGIYDQIRAMQSPEEERQRLQLENRLASQGRLGVSTSMYGGTPEQLAMEKAQAEARNSASYQAIQQADQLASSQQQRATQLSQLGLSAEQVQSQLDSEGFGREMQLGQGMLQSAQAQSALTSEAQQRQAQLAQLGMSAEQIQQQLTNEGFNQQLQLGQANLQSAQTQEGLQSSVQARQAQLAQLGMSAQQVQQQLINEGFGQQLQLGQANIQANQAQSALDSESQQRALQLAQLGLTTEQIQSQLASEGLNRNIQSAQTASGLAQTASGLQTEAQNRGQGLFGLGLQTQQASGQMTGQDIQNVASMMQASGIPLEQQLAALQPTLQAQQMQQSGQLAQLSALSQLGTAELGMLKELGLGGATLDQELLRTIGNIFAGSTS